MTDYRKLARQDARKYKLSPGIFTRQIGAESGFNPSAVSPAGARGIAQIMPGTARGLGVNPDDPVAALDAAAKLMRSYLDKYGSYRDALVAYNAGPGRVGGPLPGETQRYVSNILGGGPVPQTGAGRAAPAAGGMLKAASQTSFDQAAYDEAQKRFVLAGLIARTQGTKNPLFASGLLSLTPPTQTDFVKTGLRVTSAPNAPRAPGVNTGATAAPTGRGVARFEGTTVAGWIAPILAYARQRGWKGSVNSGYRSFAEQKRIYDSGVRPAAVPGTSNHEGTQFPRGAVDVSDAAQLAAILAKSKYAKLLVWAGGKDPVHFSHPHNGSY